MIAAVEPALDDVLAELGAPVLVEVLDERQELLRFGASRITYQHSEQQLRARVLLIRAGRAAWGVSSSLDPEALDALRSNLEAATDSLPLPTRPSELAVHRTAL